MDALSSPAYTLLQGNGGGVLSTSSRHHEPLLFCSSTPSATAGHLVIRSHSHLSNKPKPLNPRTIAALPSPKHRSSRAVIQPSVRPARTAVVSHTGASTGYALALLDAARCSGTVELVRRDALRIQWGVADGVTGALQEGGLCWQTAALVRMLIRKDKAELVGEVMREVRRLCDELVISGTAAGKVVTAVAVASSGQRRRSFAY